MNDTSGKCQHVKLIIMRMFFRTKQPSFENTSTLHLCEEQLKKQEVK